MQASTAAKNGSADAKSETCYGDNTCEVFGDFNVNATNIHLQARRHFVYQCRFKNRNYCW